MATVTLVTLTVVALWWAVGALENWQNDRADRREREALDRVRR